jgi:hypothetical protein
LKLIYERNAHGTAFGIGGGGEGEGGFQLQYIVDG